MAIDLNRQTLQHLRTKVAGKQVSASTILEGEIAVRYSHNDPALMIKDEDNHIVEFISSGAVHTAIETAISASQNTIQSEIEALEARVSTAESAITENKDDIVELSSVTEVFSSATYVEINNLSAGTVKEINTLTTTVNNFSAATVAEINTLKSTDDSQNEKIATLSGAVSSITNTYATKKELSGVSGDIKTTIDTLSSNTNATINTVSGDIKTTIDNLSAGTIKEINTIHTTDEAQDQKIATLSGAVSSLTTNYATKQELSGVSGDIKTTIDTLSSNTNATINTVSGDIKTTIDNLSAGTISEINTIHTTDESQDQKIATLSGAVSSITNTYATKQELSGVSGDIKTTIDTLSSNTNATINTVSGDIKTTIDTFSAATVSALATEKSDRESGDNNIRKNLSGISGSLVTYIDKKAKDIQDELGTVYHIKGSVADYASLPTTANQGDVYNVVASGVTTDTAIEGSGKTFEAGSNFVWVTKNDASGYTISGWDIMGGTVDFTALNALSSSVISEINTRTSEVQRLDGRIDAISGAVSSLTTNYATKAELSGVSGDIKTTIDTLSSNTNATINTVSGDIKTTIDNLSAGTVAEINTLKSTDDSQNEKIATLSGAVSSITNTYATKKELSGVSGDIKTTIDRLSSNTNSTINTVSGAIKTTIDNFSAGTVAEINTLKSKDDAQDKRIDTLSGAVSSITNTYATKKELSGVSGDIKTTIDTLSSNTNSTINTVSGAIKTTIDTFSAATVKDINALKSADEKLTADLKAVSGVAVTAIQDVVLSTVSDYDTAETMTNKAGSATGVYLEHDTTNNKITLDLTYLSVDCGEF